MRLLRPSQKTYQEAGKAKAGVLEQQIDQNDHLGCILERNEWMWWAWMSEEWWRTIVAVHNSKAG